MGFHNFGDELSDSLLGSDVSGLGPRVLYQARTAELLALNSV